MAGVLVLLLVLPLGVLVWRALSSEAWFNPPDGVWTALGLSLWTTFLAVCIMTVFGTPLAYILARWNFRFRRVLVVLVQLPIVLPPAVAGLALLVTFGRRGALGPLLLSADVSLPFTTAAVVLAQVFVASPFFIRTAQIGFENVPRPVENAASVDGADGWRIFWYVTFPLALRALAGGLVLSWARALGEFGATILFAGSLPGETQTMPLLIYAAFERDINAAIWTGVVLIGMALVALLVAQYLLRGRDTYT